MPTSHRRVRFRTTLLLTLAFATAFAFSACGDDDAPADDAASARTTLKLAVQPNQKKDIGEQVKELAAKDGIDIEIVTVTNAVNDHELLENGDVDVDFNSHVPWFNEQVRENGFKQSYVANVFLSPTGLFSEKLTSLDELNAKKGATIAISKDVSNQARSLSFLEGAGLIKLAEGKEASARTLKDIAENPSAFRWKEVDLEATPRALPDVDASVVLGTIAAGAGLEIKDALAHEPADNPLWAIGIVLRTADVDKPEYRKVVELFNSAEIKRFIETEYPSEEIIPAFGKPVGNVR